jgi:hypothetical protein
MKGRGRDLSQDYYLGIRLEKMEDTTINEQSGSLGSKKMFGMRNLRTRIQKPVHAFLTKTAEEDD